MFIWQSRRQHDLVDYMDHTVACLYVGIYNFWQLVITISSTLLKDLLALAQGARILHICHGQSSSALQLAAKDFLVSYCVI